ncbi:TPM domain-containing protein [Hymenobacter chitinivorans]|uniref:TPM domain-containing protein n=1 Tax=Hymenobacter chitinivorans DSM 11115 TaxID=1121954 RepID=A0A2M9B5P3_9BACT|nr:TPM domain-containing protein [Hymenobacter chitinivorans]PJJ53260.1 uncharacterized protein CLV45_3920 [Hymenobacter chitinivorans DSM 11115]
MLLRCFLFRLLFLLLLLGPAARPAAAQDADYLTRLPDPKTLGESYVSDPDHLLQPATVQELNATLRPLDQSGRAHIDVVLTRSIGEEVPKTAATALFNRWKIGDKDKNNGLLLLVVDDQHRVEFETGYGLEADVPDVVCFRIQQRYMIPYLRGGQYDEAVRQGVAALIRQLSTGHFALPDSAEAQLPPTLADEPHVEMLTEAAAPADPTAWSGAEIAGVMAAALLLVAASLALVLRKHTPRGFAPIMVLGLVLILGLMGLVAGTSWPVAPGLLMALGYAWPLLGAHVYLRLLNRQLRAEASPTASRHARYNLLEEAHHGLGWLRFVFPLTLAWYWRGYWRRLAQLREEPYACPACATPMHRLDETQDDAALRPGQIAEEQIAAIDYDAWQCPACEELLILSYPNLSTDAKSCPKCHNRTLQPQPDEEVRAATTSHGGWGWHVHECAFCHHVKKQKYSTAKLSSSSSSSSSSSFSSGSSSSSSSSSGGSSGGGGAGSSW